ncbi:MAG: hypothetical protein QOK19_1787 [Solirubrobacteraceae bacterium]|jgi:CHASE2 domain-containing sensor protein|nr:hypothetical protein [Solirubrobacterales bacterium]MEA2216226.1 hypothetical protein [Solirubrobacteraceae bacterium]
MIAAIVEVGKLLGVVRDAIVATLGLTTLFSLAILGFARASERRGSGTNAVFGYAAIASICLLCCLAAVIYGVAILASK